MREFTYTGWTTRVVFGTGTLDGLREEAERLGRSRVLVLTGPRQAALARKVRGLLTPLAVGEFTAAAPQTPVEVTRQALTAVRELGADCLVAVGGGSVTGLSKALSLRTGLPQIVVPTTYAGSEATTVWGLTEGNRKSTGTDPRVLPKVIVYDPALTLTLPVPMSVASGLNALAHCVDAMWAPKADPINAAFALEGIRALAEGLPKVVTDPSGIDGREHALYAAYLSAVAFASAGSGLHHKICHVLGGAYNLPHAQTHATVLPYVLAFNGPAAPDAERRIATAFGSNRAIDGLEDLRRELGAPRALRDYGFAEDAIPEAAEAILPAVPPGNPRPVTAADLERLLRAAWSGADPREMG
jgi:alcohol dehydrogenase class IV